MKKAYHIIGYSLFILYLFQEIVDLRWEYLLELQSDETFKRWSGLVLLVYIIFQWTLTFVRMKPSWEHLSGSMMTVHKWMGAVSPLMFYIHAMEFGFAYLLVLTMTFFANLIIGFINPDDLKSKPYWFFQSWMISHVAFSLTISLLVLYHIWIVFYYN